MNNGKETGKEFYIYVVDDEWKEEQESPNCLFDLKNNSAFINNEEFKFLFEEDIKKAEDTCKYVDFKDGEKDIDVAAVLLDVKFPENDKAGLALLNKIYSMDPSLPVVMLTEYPNLEDAYNAGVKRARGYWGKSQIRANKEGFLKFLYDQIDLARKETIYDQVHKEIANDFAGEYDEVETRYPGTVAYWYFENEIISRLMDSLTNARKTKNKGTLSVIDIGCGTGRIARLLTDKDYFLNKRLKITNLDFSGKMLKQLKKKIKLKENDSFRIIRAVAERIPEEDNKYDVVIMGFGFLSYTKYYDTLKSAFRLCKPGGDCIISVYNEDSILYETIRNQKISKSDSLLAAIPHKESGKLSVAEKHTIDCEVFSLNSIKKILSRVGFFDVVESWSFPTLYASVSKEELRTMPDFGKDEVFGCEGFSKAVLMLDMQISKQLNNRGHYLVLHVKKPEDGV